MKGKKIGIFVLLGLFTLALGGCASSMTAQKDMFLAPGFTEGQAEKVTNVLFPLPAKLDVADSAFLYEAGINSVSYSWKAIVWKGKEKKEMIAVRLEIPAEKSGLLVSLPGGIENFQDSLVAVIDHSGKRLYNQRGEFIYAPEGWRKVKKEDFPGFFTVINSGNCQVVTKGTDDYTGLMDFYKQFRAIEAMQIRDSLYHKHGIPLGSVLTAEQLKRIEKDPATDKIKEFFFDKWYLLFTYPLLSPTDYGVFIFVAKVFQIPSIWWKDDLNKPGYMDRQLTAASAFDMMDYYSRKYGALGSGQGGNQLLPQKLRQRLKEIYGKDFNTYNDFNFWMVEEYSQ